MMGNSLKQRIWWIGYVVEFRSGLTSGGKK